MNSYLKKWIYRRPVASALAGVVALGLLSVIPPRETAARSVADHGALSGRARVIDGDTLEIDGPTFALKVLTPPRWARPAVAA